MNTLFWWFLWPIGMAFPVPTKKGLFHSGSIAFRIIYFIIGLIVGIAMIYGQVADVFQWLWFIGMKALFITVEVFVTALRMENIIGRHRYDGNREIGTRKRFARWDNLIFNLFGILSIVTLIVMLPIISFYVVPVASLNNAWYFNSLIKKMPIGTFPFNQTIPDDRVRVVTEELAQSIASQHISEFGSGRAILSTDITMYNGKLVWVSLVGTTNPWSNDPEKIFGLIIIDATDPTGEPTTEQMSFAKGEGLLYHPILGKLDQIQGMAWYTGDTTNAYGRAYITQDDSGNWRYVVTSFKYHSSLVREFTGVYSYDAFGNLVNHYLPGEIPQWVSQPCDEQVFLEQGIAEWGSKRRGDGFDFWAGGYGWPLNIAPSQDMVQISEDTRYIFDPETDDIVALVAVNPTGQPRSLAGMFKATRTEICYYDLRDLNLISGISAEDHIESQLPPRSTGQLYGTMPLLYNVNGTLAWYVPVYWAEQGEKAAAKGTIRFEGLGIIDASNKEHFYIGLYKHDMSMKKFVEQTRLGFLGQTPVTPPVQGKNITGTLIFKAQNEVPINGTTTTEWFLQIRTDNATIENVWAYSKDLDRDARTTIMLLQTGDRVEVVVDDQNNLVRFIQP